MSRTGFNEDLITFERLREEVARVIEEMEKEKSEHRLAIEGPDQRAMLSRSGEAEDLRHLQDVINERWKTDSVPLAPATGIFAHFKTPIQRILTSLLSMAVLKRQEGFNEAVVLTLNKLAFEETKTQERLLVISLALTEEMEGLRRKLESRVP